MESGSHDDQARWRTAFRLHRNGQLYGSFETGLPGSYNLENVVGGSLRSPTFGLSAAEIAPAFAVLSV